MNEANRIEGEHVDISYEAVQSFFEQRSEKDSLQSKYSYVLFQDDNPQLAEQRDRQEKEKISALLRLSENDGKGLRVLDIGCGIGRWGETLLDQGYYYVGMDASPGLIALAEKNLPADRPRKLLVGLFQELTEKLAEAGETEPFDYIFVNGVFMYLNDADYQRALCDILKVCGKPCTIYIKESAGVEERLTLREVYSNGMRQNYSAIYRAIKEYRDSQTEAWGARFALLSEGVLFDQSLAKHKETTDYYFIWHMD